MNGSRFETCAAFKQEVTNMGTAHSSSEVIHPNAMDVGAIGKGVKDKGKGKGRQ